MTTTANRIPIDPDLETAIIELGGVAIRLRQIEEDLVINGSDPYETYSHRIVTLNDARRAISGRAERMAIRPGSLLLFIEEFHRLRHIMGRKPNLAQLQRSVEVARVTRERDLSTRKADAAIAAFKAKYAEIAVEDSSDAVSHLEACRG